MTTPFDRLGRELDRQSYDWIADNYPEVSEAIETATLGNATPEQIRRFVLSRVGPDRAALATRCEAASRFILSQREGTKS